MYEENDMAFRRRSYSTNPVAVRRRIVVIQSLVAAVATVVTGDLFWQALRMG